MASSSSGSSCGRNGGTGNHSAGCLLQPGMTPARASDDLPLPEAPSSSTKRRRLASLAPQRVQGLERLEDVVAAPKEDRRVRFLEGHEARIGRPLGIPVEDIERIEPAFQQTDPSSRSIALLRLGREVDVLDVAEDPARLAGLDLDRKDRLATLARLHQLRKAPFGGHPARRQQRDHRLALAQLLIERLLPVGTGLDAASGSKSRNSEVWPWASSQAFIPPQPTLSALLWLMNIAVIV